MRRVTDLEARNLPKYAVIQLRHPHYDVPVVAVHKPVYDGSLRWEVSGHEGLMNAPDLFSLFAHADAVVLSEGGA